MKPTKQPDRIRDLSTDSEEVARFYDDFAAGYNETIRQWQYDAPRQAAAMLSAKLPPQAVILDAGCGTGLSVGALQAAGFSTIDGIDISAESIKLAEKTGGYRRLQCVDMQQFPFPLAANDYDGLVCVGVMTYLPDSENTVREFCRVVKANGFVVLTQRTDLFAERDFAAALNKLADEGLIDTPDISAPAPYLPQHEQYADSILAHYISFTVL